MDKKAIRKFDILAIIILILMCYAITPIYFPNDTFYSIKVGLQILQNGIDMKDHFAWHEDLPYTYPHWAYDAFIGLLYNWGGFSAICISTIVLACILGVSIYFVNIALTKNRLTSLVTAIMIIFLLGENFITTRAQLVSYILFMAELYCIEQFLESKRIRFAVGLIIIAAILANIHIAVWPFFFVLFLPYIGEFGIAVIRDLPLLSRISFLFTNMYKVEIGKNRNTSYLILIFVICLFTGFLTPIGFSPYTYLYKSIAGPSLGLINEHQPLVVIQSLKAMFVILLFLMFLTFTNNKIRLKDLFMVGGLILLALWGQRHISLLYIIGMTIINQLICNYLNKDLSEISEIVQKFFITLKGKIIAISTMLLAAVLLTIPKLHQDFFSEIIFPEGTCDFIVENMDVNNMKLFNGYDYGSYLLFREIPVFIDSRADLYTKKFNGKKDIFPDYSDIMRIKTHYETKFAEYGITHVILHKTTSLNVILEQDERYKELYSDEFFVLYERISNSDNKNIENNLK
ncbi:hypothetical protein FACS189426_17320 [Bacteroidia bacterium]|nr:hypothetical protein FACS189426_17320 [Bacteroidia bacterium]